MAVSESLKGAAKPVGKLVSYDSNDRSRLRDTIRLMARASSQLQLDCLGIEGSSWRSPEMR